ncbi:MAG: tape measure protein [Thermoleophilia bacterium]
MARDAKAAERALSGVGKGADRGNRGLRDVGRSGGLASRGMNLARTGASGLAEGLGSVESTARRAISAVTLAGAAAASALGLTGFSFNKTQDRQRVAFKAMTGSAQQAEKIIRRVQKIAKDAPLLDVTSTGRAVQTLMAYDLSTRRAFQVTQALGDAAAGSGQDIEQSMGRAALAIGQIQSKGKLSAEELNQLAESVAVGRGVVARELGMTGDEFQTALEQGAIKSGPAIDAILGAIRKKFRGAAKDMSKVTEGQGAGLGDVWAQSAGNFTRPFYDAWGRLMESLSGRLSGVDFEGAGKRVFAAVASGAQTVMSVVAGVDWPGVIQRVKAIAEGAAGVVGQVIDALKPAMPFLQNVVLPLLKGVAIGVIAGVVAAFKVAVPIIKIVATVLGWVGKAAKPLRGVIQGIGVAIGFLAGGPILRAVGWLGKTFGAAGGLVGGFGKAVQLAARVAIVPVQILSRVFGVLFGAIGRIGPALDRGLTFVRRWVGFMTGLPGRIAKVAVNIVGSFANLGPRLGQALRAGFSGIVSAIGRFAKSAPDHAKAIGSAIVKGIIAAIKAAAGQITAAVLSIIPGPVRDVVGGIFGSPSRDARTRAATEGLQAIQARTSPYTPRGQRAQGGRTQYSGLHLVGELGPEIIGVGRGARVLSHSQTREALRPPAPAAAPQGPASTTINLNLPGVGVIWKAIVDWERREVAVR